MHLWKVTFSLGDFRRIDIVVETNSRSFEAAEDVAELLPEQNQTWPGPVEIQAIEYLCER